MKKKKKFLLASMLLSVCLFCMFSCNTSGTTETDTGEVTDPQSLDQMKKVELEDGAIYRISTNSEEDEFEKGALTVDKFGTYDNSMIIIDMYGKHLSQLWRVHKNDDGTYSLENMASRMYLSIRSIDNYKKEKKLSACLDGTNDEAKKWNIYSVDGTIEKCVFENVYTSYIASGSYNSVSHITYVQQEEYKSDAKQQWTFKKMDDGDKEYPYVLVLKGDYEGASSCPEILYYNGVYYNYNMTGPIALKTSTDLITWTRHPDQYALPSRPAWMNAVSGGDAIWAPGAYQIGDKYYLYYCTSSSGSQNSGIGVAVTSDPSKNDWQDLGLVIRSYTGSQYNCIDPNVIIDDDGTPYLVWGSYWEGIFMRKIDPSTGKLDETDTTMYHLAKGTSDMEAPYVIKHGDYYYLFTARGGLKKGTYYWAVGRSKTLTGPYVDKDGKSLLEGGGTRLTEWKDGIEGVAHAQYFVDKDGTAYMVSESWEYREDPDDPTSKSSTIRLHISTIVWTDDGWPVTALDKNVLSALK